MRATLALLVIAVASLAAGEAPQAAALERSVFGRAPDGTVVEQFDLRNGMGASARVISYGAIVADLRIPDRTGKTVGVVREITPSAPGFERGFGQSAAVFGRFANRIAHGRFTLDGHAYEVTRNAGEHHIHGGRMNFSRVIWQARPRPSPTDPAVELSYTAADGEEGFPGKLAVTVIYTLTRDNTLRIEYRATSDRPTPVNLTNHAYFNLAGSGDVLDHELTIHAERVTAVDADLIPTGEIIPVRGTPLDFSRPAPIGARAAQLGPSRRYDNNFVLNRPPGDTALAFAARVRDPGSGRVMEVWTTQPGLQLYTSPLGPLTAAEKAPRFGFYCFETQHYPDSVNHANFPSTILRPGETFRSTTEFRFPVP